MSNNTNDDKGIFGFRGVGTFLAQRKGRGRFDITDVLTYLFLIAGVIVMFGPVLWLIMSSFKDESLLFEPRPTFLPYRQARTHVEGHDGPLMLYDVTFNHVFIEDATVTIADLLASNGVALGIDQVLLTTDVLIALAALDTSGVDVAALPTPADPIPLEDDQGTVWQFAQAETDLSVTVQLLEYAGVSALLNGEEDRTLLAPTNAAFEAFMAQYGAETLAALLLPEHEALLRQVLLTHVLDGKLRVVHLYRALDQPLPTLASDLTLMLVPGETLQLAQIGSPTGAQYTMIDPDNVAAGEMAIFKYSTPLGPSTELKPVREVYFNFENYTGAMDAFDFWIYLKNSVIVTLAATVITLIINSMAAFALSKYKFAGRDIVFLIIISTLMVPVSVIMIPAFLVISKVGWVNSLWGLIIPGAATPTGVFLLRQYMLTIPDELLDSARIDGASEWRIYWQIILPLARPALAVLTIFSIMWRWNDFLWPLIVVSRNDRFTLQVGLNAFQGGLDVQWHYILAMTVLTLLPITLVFA
ncbi:MAG: ABC transporter permease subunit, partial [Anaerolineae bacterium]|nr:ABC transporter permease subunit [Anaerolineae bacterium]